MNISNEINHLHTTHGWSSTIWGISPTKFGQMTQIFFGTTDNGEFNANKRYPYQRLTGFLLSKPV
jgi:hypothetical protein